MNDNSIPSRGYSFSLLFKTVFAIEKNQPEKSNDKVEEIENKKIFNMNIWVNNKD